MYNQLTLLIMNHACNLIVSPFDIFQARFKEFGEVGLSTTRKVYKVFTEVGQSPWLREALPWPRQCNKLHSTICIVLLSEFVSQNTWLQQGQTTRSWGDTYRPGVLLMSWKGRSF